VKICAADALAAILLFGVLTCWAPGYWPEALVEISAFGMVAWWIIRRKIDTSGPAFYVITGLALWGPAQLASGLTACRFQTAKAALYWGANAATFFVARAICNSQDSRNRFLRSLLWLGSIVSLFVVLEFFTSAGKVFWWFSSGQDRVFGPFLYKNACAAFVELLFPLAVYQSLLDDRDSLVYIGAAATMFAAVMTTASRAGGTLLAGELGVLVFLTSRRGIIAPDLLHRRLRWTAIFSVALIGVVGWQTTVYKFAEPEPYRIRGELLRSSLSMAAERPMTGFGLGTWSTVYPAYARFDDGLAANHAHCDWVEWSAEGGVLFAALVVWLAAWSFKPSVNSLWGIGVPAVFMHSLVDYPLREPALAAVLFALTGALAARTSSSRICET